MADYSFSVDFRGFREFLQRLGAGPQIIKEAKSRILTELAGTTLSRAKQETPVRSGLLKASINMRIGAEEARVGTNLSYARHQEYGTKPHIITIRTAQVLADKRRGLVFGKIVHHPGFKGKYYMKKGLDEAKSRLSSILQKVGNDIKNKLSFRS